MSCSDTTPWTVTEHPYPVIRRRVTAGGSTNQSTGEWTAETTESETICGSLGLAGASRSASMNLETLRSLADGQFVAGDQYFVCHSDCDVALNDLIVLYGDVAGTSKTYWRIISYLKPLTTLNNLRGYGMNYWLVRKEVRDD